MRENTGQELQELNRQMVLFENICSMEYYQKDGRQTQVLRNISFEARAGEVWCVTGNSVFEIRLLLEIAANAKPYQTGRCVLNARGMMRKKRVILPHVYYIGGTGMTFHNMKVLEYLMFITSKSQEPPVQRQRRIFQQLLELGLGYLSLTAIDLLTPEERSVVTLIAASYTDSRLIVWNLPRLFYSEMLTDAAARLCRSLREQGRTVLFSAQDYRLAQAIATHLLFIKRGEVFYEGRVEPFVHRWDNLVMTIRSAQAEEIGALLPNVAPECSYTVEGELLRIYDPERTCRDMARFFALLAVKHFQPDQVIKNRPCIENAVQKVREEYDL